jgi:hypothetical protein
MVALAFHNPHSNAIPPKNLRIAAGSLASPKNSLQRAIPHFHPNLML